MGLKEDLFGFAIRKAVEKTIPSEKIDQTVNNMINGLGKIIGANTVESYTEQIKSKNCFVVKVPPVSVVDVLTDKVGNSFPKDWEVQRFYDLNNSLHFYSKTRDPFVVLDRTICDVYDVNKEKIGEVKENLVSVGIPLLEKGVKKCSVKMADKVLTVLKKSESFGEIEFQTTDGKFEIKYDNESGSFKIFRGNECIIRINSIFANFSNDYIEKYVVEYDDVKDQKLAVLLTVGIMMIE